MIHKSACIIGTLVFKNGNRNTLWLGHNRNTGGTIVWQHVKGARATRVTGNNLDKLALSIQQVIASGEASWSGDVMPARVACIRNTPR